MLEKLMKNIKSKYKDEVILKMFEENEENENLEFIEVDNLGIQYVIGRKGIPKYKVIQIAGFEDAGKSLLAQYFIIQLQKQEENSIPVLFDTENAFDKEFFEKLGGDIKRIVVITPKSLEQLFDLVFEIEKNVRNEYGEEPHILYVVDSLSLALEDEIEKDNVQMGLHARALSRFFRKIKPLLPKMNATFIYVSQNKEKIGSFIPGVARLGGHAVEFAPILTLTMKRLKEEKNNEGDVVGVHFRIKAEKNHIAVPFKETELFFSYKKYSFVNGYNIVSFAIKFGFIEQSGKGWFIYNGKKYRLKDLIEEVENDNELIVKIRKEFGIC